MNRTASLLKQFSRRNIQRGYLGIHRYEEDELETADEYLTKRQNLYQVSLHNHRGFPPSLFLLSDRDGERAREREKGGWDIDTSRIYFAIS